MEASQHPAYLQVLAVQVLALIDEHAPHHLRPLLRENLRPAIALDLQVLAEDNLPPGASKIGGAPDVPNDFEWSHWNNKPLGFLAQFSLEEVAPFDVEKVLPDSGTLSFFYDIDEQPWGFHDDVGGWRVFYWPREIELVRANLPMMSAENQIPAYAVDFAICWTLPDRFSPAVRNVQLSNSAWDEWDDFARTLDVPRNNLHHQLLGEAMPIQNDVLEETAVTAMKLNSSVSESQRAELAAQWKLLFQLDSQHNEQTKKDDWAWGDLGMLYFCIRRDELKNANFDNVWLQLQCT